jgi:hypothetical protein
MRSRVEGIIVGAAVGIAILLCKVFGFDLK